MIGGCSFVSRSSETSSKLYGHVHLLCHNIPKIPHLAVLLLSHIFLIKKQWDAAL